MASSKEIEDVILTEIEKAVLRERDKRIVRERKLLNFRDGVLSLLLPGHKTKTRRRVKGNKSKLVAILIFILGVVIALITNIASSTLPESLAPYLWLSWPLLLVLTIISALLMIRQ